MPSGHPPNAASKAKAGREVPLALWERIARPTVALLILVAIVWGLRWGGRVWLIAYAQSQILNLDSEEARVAIDHWGKWTGRDSKVELARLAALRWSGDRDRFESQFDRMRRGGGLAEQIQNQQWLWDAQQGRVEQAELHRTELLIASPGMESDVYQAMLQGYTSSFRLGDARRLLAVWESDLPNEPRQKLWRARLFALNYEIDKASKDYEELIEVMPRHWRARLEFAEVLREQKKNAEALAQYEVLIKLPEPPRSARVGMAATLLEQGDAKRAGKILEPILSENPDDSSTRFLIAQTLLESGDADGAVAWCESLVERWPENIAYLQSLNRAYVGSGKSDKLAEIAARTQESQQGASKLDDQISELEKNPADLALRVRVGIDLMRYRSAESGFGYLRSALSLAPDNIDARRGIAEFFRKENRKEEARQQEEWLAKIGQGSAVP